MYNISNKIIENILREIESKLSENGEYKISISDVVQRFDVSVSTAYNVLRILRTYYENDSYDVIFAKSELKIKKLK